MPGVTWEGENDRKLFMFLLASMTDKLDFEGAAAVISNPEVACTATAVSSRIKKLRAMARKTEGMPKEGTAAPAGEGSKKAAKRTTPADEDGDDDEDVKPPPAKKGRKAASGAKGKAAGRGKKSAEKVVEEDEQEGEVVKGEEVEDA